MVPDPKVPILTFTEAYENNRQSYTYRSLTVVCQAAWVIVKLEMDEIMTEPVVKLLMHLNLTIFRECIL